jgi:hypothetical protein
MKKIVKLEYTAEFSELVVKQVKAALIKPTDLTGRAL